MSFAFRGARKEKLEYHFNDAKCTYLVTEKEHEAFSRHCVLPNGLILNYTNQTEMLYAESTDCKTYVIGICVDAHGEIAPNTIADHIVNSCKSILDVLQLSRRFAGNFIILFSEKNGFFAFTDTISACQINYATWNSKIFIGSTDALVGNYLNAKHSKIALSIKNQATAPGYQLPGDLTFFENVKILLANHYIDLANGDVKRYWPINRDKDRVDIGFAVERTIALQKNIIKQYENKFSLEGSLTGGLDSRTVFALLKQYAKKVSYYTFFHKDLPKSHGDIIIPQKLRDDYNLNWELLEHQPVTESYQREIVYYGGPMVTPDRVQLVYTFAEHFDKLCATVNGNVFEELGRNMMGKTYPDIIAPIYLAMHESYNYSNEAANEYKKQFAKIKDEGFAKKLLDLMSWESKCGRWISDSMTTYALAGRAALNLCNCREIMELWTSIDKKQRAKAMIHQGIINKLDKKLLDYPVNPDRKKSPKWRENWIYTFFTANPAIRKIFEKNRA